MNRILLGLTALMTLAFAWLFIADLQGYFSSVQKPVAVLKSLDGTVRRLGENDLSWDRANRGALFASNDTVSTGEGASAKLTFYGGGELELGPGAMVVLSGNVEELKLNFVSGTGRVRVARKAKKKFVVTQGEKVARAKKKTTPAPEVKESKVKTAPQIAKPRIQVETVDDLKIEEAPSLAQVKAQQTASAPPASGAAKPTTTAAKLEPKKLQKKTPEPKEEEPPEPDEEEAVLAKTIKEKTIKNKKALSTNGKIASVLKLPPVPTLLFPANDKIFNVAEGDKPQLKWEAKKKDEESEAPTGYEIILRPEGKGKAKVYRSKRPQVNLSRLGRGKYLWSVRAIGKSGKRGPAARARTLEILRPTISAKPTILPVKVE